PGAFQDFTVTFSPTMGGVRTAIVTLASNDPDENPYTFMVQGTGNCPTISISATPTSGPVATVVTVNSAANLTGATATVNGVAALVTPVSANQIKVEVPAGATSGALVVTNSQGCEASVVFTVIDNLAGSCQGGNTAGN